MSLAVCTLEPRVTANVLHDMFEYSGFDSKTYNFNLPRNLSPTFAGFDKGEIGDSIDVFFNSCFSLLKRSMHSFLPLTSNSITVIFSLVDTALGTQKTGFSNEPGNMFVFPYNDSQNVRKVFSKSTK